MQQKRPQGRYHLYKQNDCKEGTIATSIKGDKQVAKNRARKYARKVAMK